MIWYKARTDFYAEDQVATLLEHTSFPHGHLALSVLAMLKAHIGRHVVVENVPVAHSLDGWAKALSLTRSRVSKYFAILAEHKLILLEVDQDQFKRTRVTIPDFEGYFDETTAKRKREMRLVADQPADPSGNAGGTNSGNWASSIPVQTQTLEVEKKRHTPRESGSAPPKGRAPLSSYPPKRIPVSYSTAGVTGEDDDPGHPAYCKCEICGRRTLAQIRNPSAFRPAPHKNE